MSLNSLDWASGDPDLVSSQVMDLFESFVKLGNQSRTNSSDHSMELLMEYFRGPSNETNLDMLCQEPHSARNRYSLLSICVFGAIYIFIFGFALIGNFLVLCVIVRDQQMRNVTNIFIANLAVSDILVNLTSLWITPLYSYYNLWVWGKFMCYLVPLFQGCSIFISTLTLAAIAIDRYFLIVLPFRPRMDFKVCGAILVSIWVASTMLLTPYAFQMVYSEDAVCHRHMCIERWGIPQLRIMYGGVILVIQYALPLLVIGFCYISIGVHLRRRRKALLHHRAIARASADDQRKARLNKMLVTMVLVFTLCWLPLNITNAIRDHLPKHNTDSFFSIIFLASHVVAMSSTCWNPLVYAGMNEQFRNGFKTILCCKPTIVPDREQWL